MRNIILRILFILVDTLGSVFTLFSAVWLTNLKKVLHHLILSRYILRWVGIMPVRHTYYDPIVWAKDLRNPLTQPRYLPGVELNVVDQLRILKQFDYKSELTDIPTINCGDGKFYYFNEFFGPGDAEFLFNMIRYYKPRRIIEVGCGFSTLMSQYAISKNMEDDHLYRCLHIAIEPFENPWLDNIDVRLIRKKIEKLDINFFSCLEENDLLFIDSSHTIRPQGDVCFEYLQLLGSLQPGVLVHIHDIFTPRDYPEAWVLKENRLYNEQYLLEAFMSYNPQYSVIGSLNHLWKEHPDKLRSVCPILSKYPEYEPSSFWMVKRPYAP